MKELFVENDDVLRIALTDENEIISFRIIDIKKRVFTKDIINGRIKSVNRSLNSIFIDIGSKRNALLFQRDKKKLERYKQGDLITVEVMREEYGEKGAKVTDRYSISDSFFAVEIGDGYKISKKITKSDLTNKFGNILDHEFEGILITYRSACLNLDLENFIKLRKQILNKFQKIIGLSKTSSVIRKFYSNIDALNKIIENNNDIVLCHCNDSEIKDYIESISNINVILANDCNLFDSYNLEKQIEKIANRKVTLKNGGNIVIDSTEAMTVIDINSAKGSSLDKETLALETNLLAVEEIYKQVNLRNISGIIVCDMISMENSENIESVSSFAITVFKEDHNRNKVYPLNELNLLQITRRRDGNPVKDYILLDESYKTNHISVDYLLKLIRIDFEKKIKEFDIKRYIITIDYAYQKHFEMFKDEIIKNIVKERIEYEIIFVYKFLKEKFKINPNIIGSK